MRLVPWILAAALAGSSAAHLWALGKEQPRHAVLPIFVPVSLEHEKGMRAERGQPAGRGGEEAVELARALSDRPLPPEAAPLVERLRATRLGLLDRRERRHQLNVALMNVGVELGAVLTPEQWEWVVSHRDQLRRTDDAAVFERVLAGLR